MGFGDLVPDPIKDGAEKVTEKIGDGVEKGSDVVSSGFDKVGLEGAADWTREKGHSAANRLGADVAELQLGETEDAKELIHGSPGKLRSTAKNLRDFQKAFTAVGKGLKRLDSSHLKGEAADAFREKVSIEPPKWNKAAAACEDAAGAVERFADTVAWAQREAERALRRYKKAEQASTAHKQSVVEYNSAVDEYNALSPSDRDPALLPTKPPDNDPGVDGKEDAEKILHDARTQRDELAEEAKTAVGSARDAAPAKPSYAEQASDGLTSLKLTGDHVAGGILKGTAGIATFARSMNALDPYNITHPAEYLTNVNNTVAGLATMAADPETAAKQMWSDFKKDPAEGAGRLIPELAGTKGAGRVAGVAKAAKRLSSAGRRGVRKGERGASESANQGQHDKQAEKNPTDPVDLATGMMYLPQTDVSLPGVLPLVFRRRVESSYRSGRWFGPSWSSTVDQRLEVDAEGVLFYTDDGRLLSYPHPAPELPVLPEAGPRWPLERTPDGSYLVNDEDSGRTWHFDAPEGEPGDDGTAPLTELADRAGNRITFEYDAAGAPLRLVHSCGYRVELTTEAGRVTALYVAGEETPVVRYGYGQAGDLTTVTGSAGLPLRFEYDDRHRVTAWIDTNDRRYEYAYDDEDRCLHEGGTEGHLALNFRYSPADSATGHRTVTVTTPDGRERTYVSDAHTHIVAETDPLGHTLRTTRDEQGNPLTRTDALGRTTRFTHDEHHRLVEVELPDGTRSHAERNAMGLPTLVVDPDGARWQHSWDSLGNRVATRDPAGNTTRYTYDDAGRLTAVSDALGHTTRVRCDAAGLPTEITDPLGAVTRYRRDAFGRPVEIVAADGATTRMAWTVEGHPTRRVGPDGAVESWTYDGEGNCTSHTDPGGALTRYEYTHFDLLAARTDPDGTRYTFTHDTELNLTRVTNPQGLTWDYTYDPAGRLVAETDFDDRTVTYTSDATGQLTARTTPLGQTVAYERDAAGRTTHKHVEGAGTTTFTYDPAGRLTSATGPSSELVLSRDKLGRVKTELHDGRALSYRYDARGHLVRRTTPTGVLTTYAWDAAGNRTDLTTAGHSLTSTHDPRGLETTRTLPGDLTLAQLFDPAGRLTNQKLTLPGLGERTPPPGTSGGDGSEAGSGAAGAGTPRAAIDGPEGAPGLDGQQGGPGRETGQPDSATGSGEIPGPTPGADGAGDPPGRHHGSDQLPVLGREIPGGGEATRAGAGATHARTTLHERSYTYDPAGQLTALTDSHTGTTHFDLDPVGRVTAVHAHQWSERYAYDAAGNQADATWPSDHAATTARGPRTYTGTRLTRAGGVEYAHDAAGRLIRTSRKRLSRKPETWHYTWDAEDHLTAVTTPDGTRWRYHYDPLGRRSRKERLGPDDEIVERTDFTWSGLALVEQTTTSETLPQPVALTWELDGFRPLTQTERRLDSATQEEIDARFFSLITDLVGAPTHLISPSGEVAWRSRTTLWGTTTWPRTATAYTPLRFPGQYHDPETGLHYNVHRYYDPSVGRYLSPDPLGLAPAPNPVTYVPNPTEQYDPFGLSPCRPQGTVRSAPDFQADPAGKVLDLKSMGRPDNELVLSGHGGIRPGDGAPVTVPPGSEVAMYGRHGNSISDALGNKIETGNPEPLEIYRPGEKLPDYSLYPPDGLNIEGVPRNVTVSGETRLSQLLQANMGRVHWAACRDVG